MTDPSPSIPGSDKIPALRPRTGGQQFVVYGDCCSGQPGGLHEQNFAAVNAAIQRLDPPPEFILFTGDEIAGLTADPDKLRTEWRHWLNNEMAWLNPEQTPLWQATGNHTAYDEMSEGVFRDVLGMPANGPPGQEGLSFWVRRDDVLLVFVHTLWSGLGGEGFVETSWLREVLSDNADTRHKFVVGHHPVFPVNGFSGPIQREIEAAAGEDFWNALVENNVTAYLCGHILAFDVQVHRGVLQICSSGAGTAHLSPKAYEYFHFLQMVVDEVGLSYQVIDTAGDVRERLNWPIRMPREDQWTELPSGELTAPNMLATGCDQARLFRLSGDTSSTGTAARQTLLCCGNEGELPALWIGLIGPAQQITVIISPEAGRSPHYWLGPKLAPGQPFDFTLLLHDTMGPGGIICRAGNDGKWTSLSAASPWGLERLDLPDRWFVGFASRGPGDQPFMGQELHIRGAVSTQNVD
jgi:Calcineurin-like phosphoesterase